MAQAILSASHPLNATLVADLYALTEGNPFFVEETLKSLVATGELRQVDGAWTRRSDTHHAARAATTEYGGTGCRRRVGRTGAGAGGARRSAPDRGTSARNSAWDAFGTDAAVNSTSPE